MKTEIKELIKKREDIIRKNIKILEEDLNEIYNEYYL